MAGLANTFGRGVMTNHFIDYKNSDVILMIGSNSAENHPQAMRWILKAKQNKGAKLIVADPRLTKSAAFADTHLRHRPGTDIALLNGMINYILQNNLYFHDYVVNYTNASHLVNPDFGFHDGVQRPVDSVPLESRRPARRVQKRFMDRRPPV